MDNTLAGSPKKKKPAFPLLNCAKQCFIATVLGEERKKGGLFWKHGNVANCMGFSVPNVSATYYSEFVKRRTKGCPDAMTELRCHAGTKGHIPNANAYMFKHCRIYSFHDGLEFRSHAHYEQMLDAGFQAREVGCAEFRSKGFVDMPEYNITKYQALVDCEKRVTCVQKLGQRIQLCKYLMDTDGANIMGAKAKSDSQLRTAFDGNLHHMNLLLLRKFVRDVGLPPLYFNESYLVGDKSWDGEPPLMSGSLNELRFRGMKSAGQAFFEYAYQYPSHPEEGKAGFQELLRGWECTPYDMRWLGNLTKRAEIKKDSLGYGGLIGCGCDQTKESCENEDYIPYKWMRTLANDVWDEVTRKYTTQYWTDWQMKTVFGSQLSASNNETGRTSDWECSDGWMHGIPHNWDAAPYRWPLKTEVVFDVADTKYGKVSTDEIYNSKILEDVGLCVTKQFAYGWAQLAKKQCHCEVIANITSASERLSRLLTCKILQPVVGILGNILLIGLEVSTTLNDGCESMKDEYYAKRGRKGKKKKPSFWGKFMKFVPAAARFAGRVVTCSSAGIFDRGMKTFVRSVSGIKVTDMAGKLKNDPALQSEGKKCDDPKQMYN